MVFNRSAHTGALAALLFVGACMAGESTGSEADLGIPDTGSSNSGSGSGGAPTLGGPFVVKNLLSDQTGVAVHTDAELRDAWGIASLQERFPMAAQGSGKLVVADSSGLSGANKIALDTGITGITLNESAQIQITIGSTCGQAQMIVASETGKLWGVSTALSTTSGAVLVNRSSVGAQYTGVAIIQQPSGQGHKDSGSGTPSARPRVLAVDFHNGRVDVFDEHFQLVASLGQKFTVPNLPEGFAPFGIRAAEDRVFLTFAKRRGPDQSQGELFDQQVAGASQGIVAAFDLNGNLLWRASSDLFNVPWGMARGNFAQCSHAALLVGNHGTGAATTACPKTGHCDQDANKNGGTITVLDPANGQVLGQLKDTNQQPIRVAGLWGLTFSTGKQDLHPNGLYVAAGPDEVHGLFAVIEPVPAP